MVHVFIHFINMVGLVSYNHNRQNICLTRFYEVIAKFVIIPVTSCGCERAFSLLFIVKS